MWLGKRFFDLVFSILGLLFLSPALFVISVWILFDSGPPVLFTQERVGRFGKSFYIHKFRTMQVNSEKLSPLTIGADPRITRVGAFLRRSKFDELPQLLDVLRGKMSLVGPRPELKKFVDHYPTEAKEKIFQLNPGITDWASIYFRNENEILAAAKNPEVDYVEKILPVKIKYASEYLQQASLFTDLRIIFSTFRVLVVRT